MEPSRAIAATGQAFALLLRQRTAEGSGERTRHLDIRQREDQGKAGGAIVL
ncbi:MAG TPA: hypothetical protein VNP04_15020 [Alphaproteobacteria bacterium]|nr:hypothetical protein [Alphaproteobacteria bacterium]